MSPHQLLRNFLEIALSFISSVPNQTRVLTLISKGQAVVQGSNLHPFSGLRLTYSPFGQRKMSEVFAWELIIVVRNEAKYRIQLQK